MCDRAKAFVGTQALQDSGVGEAGGGRSKLAVRSSLEVWPGWINGEEIYNNMGYVFQVLFRESSC